MQSIIQFFNNVWKLCVVKFIRYGFPGGSDSREFACKVGDPGSIPWFRRSPGERKGSPLQYACLENSTNRGAWQATVHRIAKSWTQLSD